jgi:t-SNARE complex subunit (syntaxin)
MLRRLRSGTKNIHGINQTVFDDHREGDDREAVLKLEESIASLTEIFENLKQDVCSLILA